MNKKYCICIAILFCCTAIFIFNSRAVQSGTKFFVALLNPFSAAAYIKQTTPTQQDNSMNQDNSAPANEAINPFEGFSPNKPTGTQPPFDPLHPIVEMKYLSQESDIVLHRQNCFLKNLTKLSKSVVESELLQPMDFKVEKNSDKPQILIMHTHATESYQDNETLSYDPSYTCRSTDTEKNMVSVGKIMADKLNLLGYNTIQDATLHDYPSYNGSYDKSRATVKKYLEQYPSIKIVLDVHRDAIEKSDGTRIKPVSVISGSKTAQVMIICGADNGKMNMPNYIKNLHFASHWQNSMETLYPTFTRPVLFDYRNYNQQLTTGSLLIEVGGHANTLTEAHNAAKFAAIALANALDTGGI